MLTYTVCVTTIVPQWQTETYRIALRVRVKYDSTFRSGLLFSTLCSLRSQKLKNRKLSNINYAHVGNPSLIAFHQYSSQAACHTAFGIEDTLNLEITLQGLPLEWLSYAGSSLYLHRLLTLLKPRNTRETLTRSNCHATCDTASR